MSKNKGLYYEQQAEAFLKQQGLQALHHNYHCRFGEIDLIMLDHQTLCFIEVKYRSNNHFGGAAYSITRNKQQKILKTALHFIASHRQYQQSNYRFDALLLNSSEQIEWIRNAFEAEVY